MKMSKRTAADKTYFGRLNQARYPRTWEMRQAVLQAQAEEAPTPAQIKRAAEAVRLSRADEHGILHVIPHCDGRAKLTAAIYSRVFVKHALFHPERHK